MSASEKLAALRHLLAERFPAVPGTVGPLEGFKRERVLRTGIPAIDDRTGGLPLSSVTEVVCTAPSCGSALLIAQLLARTRATQTRVALIDANDSFDPASFADDVLAHLLWVRCHNAAEALQAVDLLARDANLGLVVLDLRRIPPAELRRTPATQWYRLQRAVQPTDLALLVETPRATVASAQLRFMLETSLNAAELDDERDSAATHLSPHVQRQRIQLKAG